MLQPTIVIVLLLRLAEALKLFDIPFAMTGGGPGVATQPLSMLAFRTGLRFFDLGYASAMAYGAARRRDDRHHALLPPPAGRTMAEPAARLGSGLGDAVASLAAICVALLFVFPIYWAFSQSLRNPLDTFTVAGFGIPWVNFSRRSATGSTS